ncbi:MAG: hypothetical protein BWY51_00902 [Parcubacteria group bacterium ADurb.Bin316]|nr:MAG: hypothetical protein BWY51_00902 [Parcubacteria group bacterium ADurb.Bin316]HOZ56403.1 DUF2304 domain-containing protein [bacterium]
MSQQLIALAIILFFLGRLFWQKRKKQVAANEFIFWLIFWLTAAIAVFFIKTIDKFFASLGFSSPSINILFYLATIVLFYLILRLRIRLEKVERNLTTIVKEIALTNKK